MQQATVALNKWLAVLRKRLKSGSGSAKERRGSSGTEAVAGDRADWIGAASARRNDTAGRSDGGHERGHERGHNGSDAIGWRGAAVVVEMERALPQDLWPAMARPGASSFGASASDSGQATTSEKRIFVIRLRRASSPSTLLDNEGRHQALFTCISANGNAEGLGKWAGSGRTGRASGDDGRGLCVGLHVHTDIQRWWPTCGDLVVDPFLLVIGAGTGRGGEVAAEGERFGGAWGGRDTTKSNMDSVCLSLRIAAGLDALALNEGLGPDSDGASGAGVGGSDASSSMPAPLSCAPFAHGRYAACTRESGLIRGSARRAKLQSTRVDAAVSISSHMGEGLRRTQHPTAVSWTLRFVA